LLVDAPVPGLPYDAKRRDDALIGPKSQETPTMDAETQAAWDAWCDSRIARLFDGKIGESIAEFTSEYVTQRLGASRKAVILMRYDASAVLL
jgi:hypothetical protein